ncbi:MAG: protoporphyrinogen oxidase HemJ [Methylococcales bacterium]|jgi:putative membrane protein|nr:protoporphyrinogen oxidase HemJ [Methylococcales bacterium]
MLWLKALHLIFMVTWFAGLFYLPRLFVYHAMSDDKTSIERFKVMERKLFYGITTPGGLLTLIFGFWMLFDYAWLAYSETLWLQIKLLLIVFLIFYHGVCWKFVKDFKEDKNQHSHVYYRWFNEMPVVALIVIILLAVLKP